MSPDQTISLPAEPRFAHDWQDFRGALIPDDSERLAFSRGLRLAEYSQTIIDTDRAQWLLRTWADAVAEPFRGVTSDGRVAGGLYALGDEGFDPGPAVDAARALLEELDDGERSAIAYPLEADEWREWYNPEWLVNRHGLRLDGAGHRARTAATALIRSCLSADGFRKLEQARSANRYLGEIYDVPHLMSEWTYHLLLFGTPSREAPWGWSLYGHHIAVNCLVAGPQLVLSPTFIGVEPTVIDRGGEDRFELLGRESALGLELMRSLTGEQRERATTFARMRDPGMGDDRWNFADERHLAGAYRDNRVIPYEGVCAAEFTGAQRSALMAIVEEFLVLLPDPVRAVRLAHVRSHLHETWWSWIGGHGPDDPFYYRIQSPVVLLEFDNHMGVWLTNTEPAKYHSHTIVRTPNGNDYGKALIALHAERTAG